MEENFIKVSPYTHTDKMKHISLSGIKECIDHIRCGHPMGFFPAGSVSRLKLRRGKFMIHDRHWQPSVIRISNEDDQNSLSYLSKIKFPCP